MQGTTFLKISTCPVYPGGYRPKQEQYITDVQMFISPAVKVKPFVMVLGQV